MSKSIKSRVSEIAKIDIFKLAEIIDEEIRRIRDEKMMPRIVNFPGVRRQDGVLVGKFNGKPTPEMELIAFDIALLSLVLGRPARIISGYWPDAHYISRHGGPRYRKAHVERCAVDVMFDEDMLLVGAVATQLIIDRVFASINMIGVSYGLLHVEHTDHVKSHIASIMQPDHPCIKVGRSIVDEFGFPPEVCIEYDFMQSLREG